MNRLRDYNAVQDALDELDPENAKKVTRLCINSAFSKIDKFDRETHLDNFRALQKKRPQKFSEDGFIELMGKIGMYIRAYEG